MYIIESILRINFFIFSFGQISIRYQISKLNVCAIFKMKYGIALFLVWTKLIFPTKQVPCKFRLNLPLFGLGPSSKGLGTNLKLLTNKIAWIHWSHGCTRARLKFSQTLGAQRSLRTAKSPKGRVQPDCWCFASEASLCDFHLLQWFSIRSEGRFLWVCCYSCRL